MLQYQIKKKDTYYLTVSQATVKPSCGNEKYISIEHTYGIVQ